MPSEIELLSMRGKGEELKEPLPEGLDARKVQAVRTILWEIRIATIKAARSCLSCPDFWTMPEAIAWLERMAEGLAVLRPHVVDVALKDVFGPAFGRGGMGSHGQVGYGPKTATLQGELSKNVVPTLASSLSRVLASCWGVVEAPALPALLEAPQAAATVALSRTTSLLLSELAGAGLLQAGAMTVPGKRTFSQGPSEAADAAQEPSSKRRKNRNRNRFAALAEDDDAAAAAAVAA
eukprot:CAMPEP_0175615336 /NCGR_PEP_ID=MMETSP0096-20121207/65316_1 /TAXON_ID=311494 /ORGANISM="Alexandrium monilatum, Strain CCMP3105" /LENGTH=235 /DNA_ID=CAMNT_0016920469 /DNA_START=8 /DNA_END=712 /DNA_ORIENTATION=+